MNIFQRLTTCFKKAPEPVPVIRYPNTVICHNGITWVTGAYVDNFLMIGVQEAPNPTTGEMEEHNCIVGSIGGGLEYYAATPLELASALGELREADDIERRENLNSSHD